MSRTKKIPVELVELMRMGRWIQRICGFFRSPDEIGKHTWSEVEVDSTENRSAKIALENARYMTYCLSELLEKARSISNDQLRRSALITLQTACDEWGQADLPAEMTMLEGKPEEATLLVKAEIRHMLHYVEPQMSQLAIELIVEADEQLRKTYAPSVTNDLAPQKDITLSSQELEVLQAAYNLDKGHNGKRISKTKMLEKASKNSSRKKEREIPENLHKYGFLDTDTSKLPKYVMNEKGKLYIEKHGIK
jgi:hypothetical protein